MKPYSDNSRTRFQIKETLTSEANKCNKIFAAEAKQRIDLSDQGQVLKLHRYFGHSSAQNLKRIINASSFRDKVNQADIDKVVEKCAIC